MRLVEIGWEVGSGSGWRQSDPVKSESGNRGADFAGEKGLAGWRIRPLNLGHMRKTLAGSSRACQPSSQPADGGSRSRSFAAQGSESLVMSVLRQPPCVHPFSNGQHSLSLRSDCPRVSATFRSQPCRRKSSCSAKLHKPRIREISAGDSLLRLGREGLVKNRRIVTIAPLF